MKCCKSKPAFSMLTAMIVMMLMSVLMLYINNLSNKTIKTTTDQYRHEQAKVLAKSYTEYAIMAVSANKDRGTQLTCLKTINANVFGDYSKNKGRGEGYKIIVNIAYIGDSSLTECNPLSSTVRNPNTPLSIMIDIYVRYNDLNDGREDEANNLYLTYHKRSLEKI